MKTPQLKLLSLLMLIIACDNSKETTQYKNAISFTFDSFQNSYDLQRVPLGLDSTEIMGVIDLCIVDSLLLCIRQYSDFLIDIYNLNTGLRIKRELPIGRGPGEVINGYKIEVSKKENMIWVYDMALQKVNILDINNLTTSDRSAHKMTIDLEKWATKNVIYYNDSIYSAPVFNKEALFMVHDAKGGYVRSFGEYPVHNSTSGYDNFTLSQIYVGEISYDERNGIMVKSYTYTDLISIIDLDNNEIISIHGPDLFYPELKVKRGDRTNVGVISGKTRLSYSYIRCKSDMISVLYSGEVFGSKIDTDYGSYNMKILCFDVKGVPLEYYNVNTRIWNFDIDSDGKYVYGLTEDEIFKFKILK